MQIAQISRNIFALDLKGNKETKSAQVIKEPLQVRPLGSFGAEVIGLKPGEIGMEEVLMLRNALLKYKMLLIRNQGFSAQSQIAFTRLFGLDLHRAGPSLRHLPDFPEIFRIINRAGQGNVNTGQYWHSDGHYLADPSAVTVMHIVKATNDGATLVADSQAALEALRYTTKEILEDHLLLAPETGVAHRIVRKHPLTGVEGLYVNLNAIAIDKMKRPNPSVSQMLDYHLSRPSMYHVHHWQAGDTMILDNFSTIHKGTQSDPANLRVMHRTSVTGQSVWWRAN